ncbi:MAG TPA: ABC transporter ATP-binding protein [Candidatus Saccharimonadia bacterium]|nr:ABC transporter ATP-binding protein [Candidatus Saccharimonadia bacterium]
MNVLVVDHLTKSYGQAQAVRDVSFTIGEGEIFALVGPNGAGKSTTLRMIATILRPSSGTITLAGHDVQKEAAKVRELITYLPEESGAYKALSGREYLRFMAGLYTNDDAKRNQCVERAEAIADLGDKITAKVSTYSKGMARKLLLARAIMTEPKLAILDEPTSGLDVLNSLEIRKLIHGLTEHGTAVLLSSHNMLEIEYLSDRIGLIVDGQLKETGRPADIKAKYGAKNLEEVFLKVASS